MAASRRLPPIRPKTPPRPRRSGANGQRVRLVRQPFAQPLGARALRAVWSRQLRWARLRRVTFPAFFCMEFLTGGLFPIAIATWLAFNDAIPGWIAPLLAVAWYAAETFLAKNLDWHYSRRSPFAWILRDLSLPVLWIAAVCGNGFEWRGNQMEASRRTACCHRGGLAAAGARRTP